MVRPRRMIRDGLVTQRGKTAVLATNSLEEAWSICDTVAILRDGRIIAHAPPKVLDAQFARFLRYHITLDNVDAAMLAKIQAMRGLRNVSSLQTIDGFSLNVELEPSGGADDEMLRVLGVVAQAAGRPVSAIVRDAIQSYWESRPGLPLCSRSPQAGAGCR